MALASGTRFGSYTVGESIGAGGMGEVYRAHDTTLARDVAIKVLPASFAEDAGRVERFDREAKTLASLNHPNIAQIYGLEKSDGTTALVMELVDGTTLEDRIAKGPIPADEALGIAMQIADALEAAHSQNIVHRDLKPANIKLKHDGTVKVLDFGIAKALAPENLVSGQQSPIMTTPATQVGVILGTAAYMSPEQAKGKAVDQRTDIWAFGCVLYEMLTGQLAFGAEDVPTTLARIIANETSLETLPATVSPAVRHTIKLCLEKDARKRVADVRDVKLALAGAFESGPTELTVTARAAPHFWRLGVPIVMALFVAIGGTAAVITSVMRPDPPAVNRFDYDLPEAQFFRFTGRPVFAVSPNGRHFVYNAADGFYLRDMGELEARIIPGTETDGRAPEFSPDGQTIVYWDGETNELKRISISGGVPVVIASVAENVHGLSWADDGTIFFGQAAGVYRVSANGGTPELVIPVEDGLRPFGLRLLPDGDSLLFSLGPATQPDLARIVVESLSTGEQTVLLEGGNDARYMPTGHIVYALRGELFAVAFDLGTLKVTSSAVPIVQGVLRAQGNLTGTANYGVSDDGTLIYVGGDATVDLRSLAWIDREGNEELLNLPPGSYEFAQLSPDGTRIAVASYSDDQDIWVWDIEREILQRLTFDPGPNSAPVWSPDGRRLAFSRAINDTQEIYWQASDGSGLTEQLTANSPSTMLATDLSPDGTTLLYMSRFSPSDIWMTSIEGPATTGAPLIATPADERSATLSPDGRWIAYESDESGEYEIYVRPFPNIETGRWQISTDGGSSPLWSPDGTELFYFKIVGGPGDRVTVVPVETGANFKHGAPRPVIEGDFPMTGVGGAFYDVSPDGQRFLMIRNSGGAGRDQSARIIIVQHWLEELNRLVPTD